MPHTDTHKRMMQLLLLLQLTYKLHNIVCMFQQAKASNTHSFNL